ncbi:hypothetical protein A6M21_12715 [Desulfotomaculum copahuensis]|uniref:Major facilitator superfamily (MFS) profile domain-containing protein n=2 Tax=Desulfotomaculum copahuensis TaxID=1838280 RepID=A0A1B7LCV8_9FIRM|nr:hypothetical protein A6M21_12715 [Desulfotomaculum copahuensis]
MPWANLLALLIGAFMAFLSSSIVSVAIPKMMAIFGVGTDTIQWVLTAYLLAAGVMIPITGFLGDRVGLKNLYILSLLVFTAGSTICSLSPNEKVLIAGRVIQAVGGGAIMPVTTAFVYLLVPREKIGTALGIRGIAMAMAPAFGPALGGFLIDRYDWHIIFLLNIPLGLLSILMALLLLPKTRAAGNLKLDVAGFLLAAAGSFTLLLGLSQGQDKGWGSYYIVMLLVTGFFALLLFALWESTRSEPLLDLSLFRNKIFTASIISTVLVTVAMYASVYLTPIFVQNLLGYSPFKAGILMIPAALAMGVITPFSGRLFDRFGAIPLCLTGMPFLALATYQLSKVNLNTSYHHLQFLLAIRSLSMGIFMLPVTAAGLNTVPRSLINRATALNSLVRQIAGAVGVAFYTYLLNTRDTYHYDTISWGVTWLKPLTANVIAKLQAVMQSHPTGAIAGARAAALTIIALLVKQQAMTRAVDDCFLISVGITVVSIPVVFFLKTRDA